MRFRRSGDADRLDVPAGTTVLRGWPSDPPTAEALARLQDACDRHAELQAVYLTQQMIPERREPPTLLLGLVVDGSADVGAIARSIGDASFPLRPGDEYADFIVLDAAPEGNNAWRRVY
jgi:hypothetical protein